AGYAYVATRDAARIKFAATADEALNRIDSRVELHLGLLRSVHASFTAHTGEVSPQESRAFFQALRVSSNCASLRGLVLAAVGQPRDEEEIERFIEQYHGEFHDVRPALQDELVAPVLIYQPIDRAGRSPVGFDLYGSPVDRE